MSDTTPEQARTIMYVLTGLGALKCSACGVLVDAGQAATHAHTAVHALIGDALDGLGVRVAALEEAGTAAPASREAVGAVATAPKADLGEPTGSGVVRVRLEGDPDDVDLAVELAEATGFPLVDVSDPYANDRKGPRGHVRRYGVVNLGG